MLAETGDRWLFAKFVRGVIHANPVDSNTALDREDLKAEFKDLFLGRVVADLACRVRGDTSRSRRPPKGSGYCQNKSRKGDHSYFEFRPGTFAWGILAYFAPTNSKFV